MHSKPGVQHAYHVKIVDGVSLLLLTIDHG